MGEVWRCLIAEITALGWRCFALGPEFWVGLGIASAIAGIILIIDIWRK